jgi:muramoyltetrapeptide carboxypeptidase
MTKIRIVSPAKAIEKTHIDFAKNYLESQGFLVEVSEGCLGNHHYFSGTDKERLVDFQVALDDNSVDVILCTRGGYGCLRIIDYLDFSNFVKSPKLIIGFSDVTVFHNHINAHFGLPTVHATMPLNFENNSIESLQSLVDVINGKGLNYELPTNVNNKMGSVKAEVVGGNLAIIYALIGTDSDINLDGKILFIEDVGEYIYTIDRMLLALKKSGKLKNLAGLIIGGMTNIKDTEVPFGKTLEEIILESVSQLNIPVCFDFKAGHIDDNRAIVLGKEAELTVAADKVTFRQNNN